MPTGTILKNPPLDWLAGLANLAVSRRQMTGMTFSYSTRSMSMPAAILNKFFCRDVPKVAELEKVQVFSVQRWDVGKRL